MNDHLAAIRRFVAVHLREEEVGDDLDLFESGLASSLFAVQIVAWCERTFGIQVTSDDLDMTNFHCIRAIADFVARKQEHRPTFSAG